MEKLFDFLYRLQPGMDENGKPKPTELGLSADGKRGGFDSTTSTPGNWLTPLATMPRCYQRSKPLRRGWRLSSTWFDSRPATRP